MQDIYADPEEDEEEELSDTEITKAAYKNVVGRLFRGYVFINFAVFLLGTVLAIDLLSGGGSITLFALFSEQIADQAPTILEFSPESLFNGLLNTLSIVAVLLLILGGWLLRKGRNRASGMSLDSITIADTDEQQQERFMRQRGYIKRGKQIIPLLALLGIAFGVGLAYLFGEVTGIVGAIILFA